MRIRLVEFMELARSSFWFLPSVMMLVGVLLFSITLGLDRSGLADAWLTRVFYSGGVENAIYLLQSLTGAMVAIATVVFSTLMLVLTLATSQFGHRLIRSFMRDRANQAVLGIFLSTFVYCMLVFHMVGNDPANEFVPGLSVTVGFALALFASCTLIYFTHHIAQLIAAPEVLETVAVELDAAIDRLYPDADRADAPACDWPQSGGVAVRATGGGYLQTVGLEALVEAAKSSDVLIESVAEYGEYLLPGAILARLHVTGGKHDIGDALVDAVAREYVLGNTRLTERDLLFATNQLAEIAVRALSPALNNPFTAVDCINRLGFSLAMLARRPRPSFAHCDDAGTLRFLLRIPGLEEALDAAFMPVRNYGRSSVMTGRQMLRVIARLAPIAQRPDEQVALRRHAEVIRDAAHNGLSEAHDIDHIDREFEATMQVLHAERVA